MVIKNATVLKDDFTFEKLDVKIEDELITAMSKGLSNENEFNAENCYLLPGFIDIHTHGCVGHDTCDANQDGYDKMSEFYLSKGVTSFLFTTMSFSEEILSNIIKNITEYIDVKPSNKNGNLPKSYSHGIYLEGPFINSAKKGAQSDKYIIPPRLSIYHRLNELSGNRIKVVAMSPEIDNGMEFIKEVSKECAISIGHTTSDYDTTMEAIENGAKDITHLFNAMPPLNHRDPGVIGAAFDSNVFMEVICDGIHLHPSIIRTIFKTGTDNRVILISDSMSAAGQPDGKYQLGGQDVTLKDGKAVLADGTLAGSASNLFDCVKNCISFGIPVESAIKAATINPARLIKADNVTGSIKVGKYADLILVDNKMNIKKVWVKGQQ